MIAQLFLFREKSKYKTVDVTKEPKSYVEKFENKIYCSCFVNF